MKNSLAIALYPALLLGLLALPVNLKARQILSPCNPDE
ncbi:uncharacterized protein METZ01_LOCUS479787, partial [marine metagenome]